MSGLPPRPPKNFRAEPFPYHEEIELRIDTLTNLGHGLGRVNGWVVMVPFALPGELVRARIYRNEKNYSDADLMEVLEPSPDRVSAPCPLFGRCGGCQYQNLAYHRQLEWKRQQVAEVLERLAGIHAEVEPVIPSPREYGYRSKITPHFQKPRKDLVQAIGFLHSGKRFDVIDVEQCAISSKSINTMLPQVRAEVRRNAAHYQKGATLLLRESEDGNVLTESHEICEQKVGPIMFRFPAGDFFQNNPSILPAFVDYVANEARQMGGRFLVDAYCGSGLFGLSCASSFEAVAGVEVSEGSIIWARENAKRNGIDNATFLLGTAETIFDDINFDPAHTVVVIDPPRKGCSPAFIKQLIRFSPAGIVYVSCNPATQMRDLVSFTEAGFELRKVQPFDLFPQTRHLECVVSLRSGLKC